MLRWMSNEATYLPTSTVYHRRAEPLSVRCMLLVGRSMVWSAMRARSTIPLRTPSCKNGPVDVPPTSGALGIAYWDRGIEACPRLRYVLYPWTGRF